METFFIRLRKNFAKWDNIYRRGTFEWNHLLRECQGIVKLGNYTCAAIKIFTIQNIHICITDSNYNIWAFFHITSTYNHQTWRNIMLLHVGQFVLLSKKLKWSWGHSTVTYPHVNELTFVSKILNNDEVLRFQGKIFTTAESQLIIRRPHQI